MGGGSQACEQGLSHPSSMPPPCLQTLSQSPLASPVTLT